MYLYINTYIYIYTHTHIYITHISCALPPSCGGQSERASRPLSDPNAPRGVSR